MVWHAIAAQTKIDLARFRPRRGDEPPRSSTCLLSTNMGIGVHLLLLLAAYARAVSAFGGATFGVPVPAGEASEGDKAPVHLDHRIGERMGTHVLLEVQPSRAQGCLAVSAARSDSDPTPFEIRLTKAGERAGTLSGHVAWSTSTAATTS